VNTIKKNVTKKNIGNVNGHKGEVLCLSLSEDVKYLASGSRDKSIKIWNPDTLDFIYSFEGHRDAVTVIFKLNIVFF
jgi:WD40 repeat protein